MFYNKIIFISSSFCNPFISSVSNHPPTSYTYTSLDQLVGLLLTVF